MNFVVYTKASHVFLWKIWTRDYSALTRAVDATHYELKRLKGE